MRVRQLGFSLQHRELLTRTWLHPDITGLQITCHAQELYSPGFVRSWAGLLSLAVFLLLPRPPQLSSTMLFLLAIITTLTAPGSATPFTHRSFQTLTTQQVSSDSPYTYHAAAGMCGADTVKSWSCGGANFTLPFMPMGREGPHS